jgi:nucleotide-binding universal stress UspA family protein
MSWGPIVVGVDGSPEATAAAKYAQRLAHDLEAPCQLVHAVRDEWAPLAAVGDAERVQEMQRLQLALARHRVTDVLRGHVGADLFDTLEVRFGPAAVVLQQVTHDQGAGLLVLGGKHHGALARWLGGSTSLNVVRAATVPVLVTVGNPARFRRILVAADLSSAARPTLTVADRLARRVGAQLRVMSVFEPLPTLPHVPPVDPVGYHSLSQELLEREIWPLVPQPVQKVIRHGMVVETLLREATDWRADLLVVGSHGKGWAQRILLGSVTESQLNHLPTSLLVVPVAESMVPAEARPAEVAA